MNELTTFGADVPAWAPAIVPVLVYAIREFVARAIPNELIVRIRDEYLPFVAVIVGTLGASIATGEVNWEQGPLVGLAGVGLHQVYHQIVNKSLR